MKTIRILIRILPVLIILIGIAVVLLVRNISRQAVPDYNDDVSLPGLTGRVEVYRDGYGIPHVYAENETDLYRVCGYLQAQDRLWQMDLLRRVTTGRLSEIFGEDYIEADRLFRALMLPEKSAKVIARSDPVMIGHMEAFAEGVNRYIEDHRGKLPFEFTVLGYVPDPWEVTHTVNLTGYLTWNLSMGWNIEAVLYKISRVVDDARLMDLVADLDIQEAIFPDFMLSEGTEMEENMLAEAHVIKDLGLEVFSGSNNWVVDGKHSSTGKPIVANDMHLEIDMAPGIWYQMHQMVPGRLHVSGVVLPGTPFVVCGHNDSIAWGMTNVMLDDMDFYLETLNSDTTQYLLDGEWRDLRIIEEKIRIKGGEEVTRINRFTHRGPLVSSFKGIEDRAISMRWIGNEFSNEPRTVYLLDRADNLDDFLEAIPTFTGGNQNIVYGDAAGNIGLFVAAGVPVRKGNRAFVMPGDTSLYDWQGLVPFDRLPYSINPDNGILVSANNRSAGPGYPYHISHWFDLPNRYNRIRELLGEKEVFTPGDMERIQADQTSKWAEKFLDTVKEKLEQAGLENREAEAFELFRNWQGDMAADRIAPSLFEVFYLQMAEAVFKDELGEELFGELLREDLLVSYVFDRILEGQESSWCDNVNTEAKERFGDLIVPAWKAAIGWLSDNYGNDMDAWKWGMLHQVSFVHPLGSVKLLDKIFRLERGPFPVGGSYHTVCPYSYDLTDPFNSNHGASQRHVFPAGDWDDSRVIIPTGVSGIPASPFFCNQAEMYIANQYVHELFSKENVVQGAAYRCTFTGTWK